MGSLLLLDALLPFHTNHTDHPTVSESQTTTHTKNNNMDQLTVLEFQDNTTTRVTTTNNNMVQLTVLESQDNTTVVRVTQEDTTVKDTADTTDVFQPEDTEEEELVIQEEDTLKDAELSTVKKNVY